MMNIGVLEIAKGNLCHGGKNGAIRTIKVMILILVIKIHNETNYEA
jgi:hypothetical protein